MKVEVASYMRLTDFKVLSFDCYGTLIDWETGLLDALTPWRDRTGIDVGNEELLGAFARHETAQESETPTVAYPGILARVLKRIGDEFGAPASDEEAAQFWRVGSGLAGFSR